MKFTTRSAARNAGAMHYNTGRPCKHGHASDRFTSNGQCMSCAVRDSRKARAERPENTNASVARWREKNKDRYLSSMSDYRSSHREYFREHGKRHMRENMPMHLAKASAYRARKRNALAAWDRELTDLVTLEAHDLAVRREAATGFQWQVDHSIPLKARNACGLHVWSNIQVIPGWMNNHKRNRLMLTKPGEWVRHA